MGGVGRNLVKGKLPGNQLKLLARVERVSELTFSYNHLGGYPNCRHRAFMMELLMEADLQIHSQTLGQVLEVQLKRKEQLYEQGGSRL